MRDNHTNIHPDSQATAGRTCPLHYRYSSSVFNRPPRQELANLEVLYVVGGLYGNTLALTAIESLFATETGTKRMVFNGDFHWFDANDDEFSQVQAGVDRHIALRGNVETELVSDKAEVGCGCAYPDWVEDGVVQHSNQILQMLRPYVTPEARSTLSALPMWAVASVGNKRVGLVHGDAESLAGWGFAQEHLNEGSQRARVAHWFEQAQVGVFASTHTCLPVMQQIATAQQTHWVINNGAAGMPNVQGDRAGLITRIATTPYRGTQSRKHVRFDELHIDLLAIEIDQTLWQSKFMGMWPQGSHAYESYWNRIAQGPNYQLDQVIRLSQNQIDKVEDV